MHDQPNNIKPIVIQPTPKRNVSRVRARKLSDIFSTLERGAPRGFVHIREVLPAVFQQIIRAIEERESQSQTKRKMEGEW